MRKFGLTIVMVAVLGAGALGTGAAASAGSADSITSVGSLNQVAGISAALGPRQKYARKRALRKCKKKRSRAARKSCRYRVIRRFRPKPVKPVQPATPAAVIDVSDDVFTPNEVNINRGDTIKWIWNDLNHDPHNVTMISGPAGVDRRDFETSSSPAVQFTFSRAFTKPGTYTFTCTLHVRMTMKVVVS